MAVDTGINCSTSEVEGGSIGGGKEKKGWNRGCELAHFAHLIDFETCYKKFSYYS